MQESISDAERFEALIEEMRELQIYKGEIEEYDEEYDEEECDG